MPQTAELPASPSRKAKVHWTALFSFTQTSHYWLLGLAIFSATCSALVQPAVSILLGRFSDAMAQFGGGLIDSGALRDRTTPVVHAFVVLGCCTLVTNAGMLATWTTFGEMQAKSVREELFRSLLEKDLEWFEMRESGISSLLTRLHTQIRELQHGVSQPAAFILSGLVEGCVAFGVALYYGWKLTLVVLASLPLSIIVLFLISRGHQSHVDSHNHSLAGASQIANNAISNPSLVKCFCTQAYETARYVTAIGKAATHSLKQSRVTAAQMGALGFLMFAMFLLGFYYGGKLVHDGDSTAGKVITIIWATFMSVQAFQNVVPHITFLARGQAAAVALRDLVDTVHRGRRSRRRIDGVSPDTCEGDIRMNQISFAYPSRRDHLVVQQCTLHFPAGRTTFLVGKSGSGKSTLGSLLMRFYSLSSGTIYIDGHDVEDLDTSWLRNNITCVRQDTVLFNETVKTNIALGHRYHKHVTPEQLLESIKLAVLEDTIADLPFGMDTHVGVGGSALSGGQIQRIVIARARIRNTSILILDESTSALDHANKVAVIDGIRKWREGLTTIFITHDVAQISGDDFVYSFEDGRVKNEGYWRDINHSLSTVSAVSESTGASNADHNIGERVNDEDKAKSHQRRRPPNLRWKKEGSGLRASFEQQLQDLDTGDYMRSPRALTRASRMTKLFSNITSTRARSLYASVHPAVPGVPHPRDGVPEVPGVRTAEQRASATIELPSISLHSSMAGSSVQQRETSIEPLPSPRLLDESAVQFRARFRGPSFKKIEEPPVQMSLQTIYTTLWANLDKIHRIKLILGFTAVCFRAALPSVFAFIMAKNFETFYMQSDYQSKMLKWAMVQLVVACIDGVTAFYSQYLLETAARRWADRLRGEAMKRILEQPMAWFEQEQNASVTLTSTLDRDAEEMRNLLSRHTSLTVNVVIMMVVAIIWSLVSCWKLTMVGLAATPIIYGLAKAFDNLSTLWAARVNSAADAIGVVFVETFTDVPTVRSFTLEAYFHRKYNGAIKTAFTTGVSRALYTATLFGLSESTVNFAVAVVLWYAVRLLSSYDWSVTPVLTSICLLMLSSGHASMIFSIITQAAAAADSATRLLRLAQLPLRDEHEHGGHVRLTHEDTQTETTIQFTDTIFAYPSRRLTPVLKGAAFTVPSGQCVAISGPSGSGKSTISSLLLGLHRPTTGLADGPPPLTIFKHDSRSIHLPTLRKLVAVVPQKPVLLPGTVWDNICYGLEPHTRLTTQQNVNWAATQAAIHDFILSLPKQYDTLIGEGGLSVSGGQAQRIAIARALVRQPRVLILDEATSALDGESAELIRSSLRAAARGEGMTMVVITHAREMMRFADKVVVLEDGRVSEEGSFDVLMAMKGSLHRLLESTER